MNFEGEAILDMEAIKILSNSIKEFREANLQNNADFRFKELMFEDGGSRRNIELAKFRVIKTDAEYEKYIKKLKVLDLENAVTLSNNLEAYFYNNKYLDIVARANKLSVISSVYRPVKIGTHLDGSGILTNICAEEVIINNVDFSKNKEINCLFSYNHLVRNIRFENIDFSNIESMAFMFNSCDFLSKLEFLNIIPPKKCDLHKMFFGVDYSLIEDGIDLTFLDNTEITDAKDMFNTGSFSLLYAYSKSRNKKEMMDSLIKYIEGLRKVITNNPKIKEAIEEGIEIIERYMTCT